MDNSACHNRSVQVSSHDDMACEDFRSGGCNIWWAVASGERWIDCGGIQICGCCTEILEGWHSRALIKHEAIRSCSHSSKFFTYIIMI